MHKDSIVEQLEEAHNNLYEFLESQHKDKWTFGPEGKWTTGQHALYLLQSIAALNTDLSFPKFILKFKYGKTNRPVRDFNTVTKKYKERLEEVNQKIHEPSKNIKAPPLSDKNYILDRIQAENKKLQYKTLRLKEAELNILILPHPLAGKMPIRERIMWTICSTNHHLEILKQNY